MTMETSQTWIVKTMKWNAEMTQQDEEDESEPTLGARLEIAPEIVRILIFVISDLMH